MAAAAILDNFEWPYLCNGSRYTYTALRGHLCDSTAFLLLLVLLKITPTQQLAVSAVRCYHNIIQTFAVFMLLLENLRMLKLANFNYTSVAMCNVCENPNVERRSLVFNANSK